MDMDEDYKKVVEATRVIAEVCDKYHHFDKETKDMICHEVCPLRYPKYYDEFACRLHNYPFDYSTEVEWFDTEEGEENE